MQQEQYSQNMYYEETKSESSDIDIFDERYYIKSFQEESSSCYYSQLKIEEFSTNENKQMENEEPIYKQDFLDYQLPCLQQKYLEKERICEKIEENDVYSEQNYADPNLPFLSENYNKKNFQQIVQQSQKVTKRIKKTDFQRQNQIKIEEQILASPQFLQFKIDVQNNKVPSIETNNQLKNNFMKQNFNLSKGKGVFLNLTKSQGIKKPVKNQEKSDKFSKYHNFSKLYFNSLVLFFHKKENMNQFDKIPQELREQLVKTISRVKSTGMKVTEKQVTKTDLYTHSHYQLVFLQLTQENYSKLPESAKKLHKEVFRIDLDYDKNEKQAEIEFQNQLFYTNILKDSYYQILRQIQLEDRQNIPQIKLNYWDKILSGIQQMNQGVIIKRFL